MTTIDTEITTKITEYNSSALIPRMFPKSAASKLLVNPLYLLIKATPKAKLAVVIIPIEESVLIFFFLDVKLELNLVNP